MVFKLFKIFSRDYVLADGVAVTAGNSKTTTELTLGEDENVVGLGYHINTILGSPKVEVEYSFGADVNGTRHWITSTDLTSTNSDGGFTFDRPAEKVRLRITETGGTSGLDGIKVWAKTRAL